MDKINYENYEYKGYNLEIINDKRYYKPKRKVKPIVFRHKANKLYSQLKVLQKLGYNDFEIEDGSVKRYDKKWY